jgi:hypothetical protein
MMRLAGQAQHRRSRLNSNVRPQTRSMFDTLENNLVATLATIVVGAIVWRALRHAATPKVRRAARIAVVLLCLPIVYIGHPFLYYPSWVVLFAGIASANLIVVGLYAVVWVSVVFVGLRQLQRNNVRS